MREPAKVIERIKRGAQGNVTQVIWYPYGFPHLRTTASLQRVIEELAKGVRVNVAVHGVVGQAVRLSSSGDTLVDSDMSQSGTPGVADVPEF